MKINLKKVLSFVDENLILGMSLFLLIFIPLYPKWPMFDVLPGYNVRVRLEDFLILLTFFIWGIWVIRKKIKPLQNPLFKPVLIYILIGFLSTISAIFITKTVTGETYQIMKLYLHLFRRIEYFSLLFIFFSALRKKEHIKLFLTALVITIIGATVYGFGQKYLYWPAYSTMNREFSKGIVLYLTEHARVLSTFGGHYDLAAYAMITLAIIIPLAFMLKNRYLKLALMLIALAEYWLLNLTASRTSFIAYLAALSVAFFFLAFKKSWWWSLSRWMTVVFISFAIMLTIGPMSERFSHIIKLDGVKDLFYKSFKKEPPSGGIAYREDMSIEDQLAIVADNSDIPPSPNKPADVYIDLPTPTPVPEEVGNVATSSAVKSSGGYSDNALKYGLSTGIRLDALWPRAIAGFKKNPLLGSGYSTLVKEQVWEQTTAESTDNDFLRLLGETGLLGFVSFLSVFVIAGWWIFKAFKQSQDMLSISLYASTLGVIAGLMVNALYIDIFESSKVAYTMWSIIGLITALAVIELNSQKIIKNKTEKS